ncbi:hypothetical protein LOK49_LG05G00763 [Camellia lanceoleosa]|uniref:Uncharacterized protein n=1 Tax=Camellia lanceoleosa TaxID=1840588 RepID=A0ACC0HSE0_9ERIC|nr:hypothetical protein LOK49_LG05G00763 [Camellia lanceoleosa]
MSFNELSLCTQLKRLPLASMEERIQLFCYICCELVIFCIKRDKVIRMGISLIVISHFQYEPYILRALLHFLKSTRSLMKQPLLMACYWISFA